LAAQENSLVLTQDTGFADYLCVHSGVAIQFSSLFCQPREIQKVAER